MRQETPPSSVQGDDEIMDDEALGEEALDEEELLYVGDLDEVLDADGFPIDNDSNASEDGEPPVDLAQLVFTRHTNSVFCGSIHPSGKFAVTGGEDDRAYVWSTETGDVLYECAEHEDSVVFASFSYDGVYLATIDMKGCVRVTKCAVTPQDPWECVWDYQAGDFSWGRWHPAARVLFMGAVAGEIYMWKIPSGETKILQGHGPKSECGVVLPDCRRLAAGYEDGSMKVWDLKSSAAIHTIAHDVSHSVSITAIDCYIDNNIIATGSLDGNVVLTKSATGKSIGILPTGLEIETISFCAENSLGYLAVGTLHGSLNIWDVGRQIIRHKCADSKDDNATGYVSLIWVKSLLVAACLDGSIRVYDSKTGKMLKMLTGHRAELLDMNYNQTANILLTTSDDGTARIFNFDITS